MGHWVLILVLIKMDFNSSNPYGDYAGNLSPKYYQTKNACENELSYYKKHGYNGACIENQ